MQAEETVTHLQVINDSAEHSVKLLTDFLSSDRSENKYQNVLQVIENDRKYLENQRKRTYHSHKAVVIDYFFMKSVYIRINNYELIYVCVCIHIIKTIVGN